MAKERATTAYEIATLSTRVIWLVLIALILTWTRRLLRWASGGSRTWASFRSSFAQRHSLNWSSVNRLPDVRGRSHEPWLPSELGFFV
jgi:hypothetical protein